MKRGFFAYRRRTDRRFFLKSILITLTVLLLTAVIYGSIQMRPILERMAVTRVSNTVNRIVSEAVNEAITNGTISYDRLISFEKDT